MNRKILALYILGILSIPSFIAAVLRSITLFGLWGAIISLTLFFGGLTLFVLLISHDA